MFSSHSPRFMFSEYESFVRLIFLASILLLEPFNSRFRFRERFYRTTHESPIGPAPEAVQVVKSIPKKMVNRSDFRSCRSQTPLFFRTSMIYHPTTKILHQLTSLLRISLRLGLSHHLQRNILELKSLQSRLNNHKLERSSFLFSDKCISPDPNFKFDIQI